MINKKHSKTCQHCRYEARLQRVANEYAGVSIEISDIYKVPGDFTGGYSYELIVTKPGGVREGYFLQVPFRVKDYSRSMPIPLLNFDEFTNEEFRQEIERLGLKKI